MLPCRFSSATTIYEVGSSSSTSIITPATTVSKKFSNAFNDDENFLQLDIASLAPLLFLLIQSRVSLF
jgi:hypothetical protein